VAPGAGRRPDTSDPELVERPKRRRFTAEYKLRILQAADACSKPGEIGALLRREGLYTSHLSDWRRQRDEGALAALDRPRGRRKPNPLEGENAELRRRLERPKPSSPRHARSSRCRETSPRFWASCWRPEARSEPKAPRPKRGR
jgi:transposase-like protein